MAVRMEKTNTPGIYRRGNRYVIVWQHKGRQHKEFHRTYAEAREAKARRAGGDRRKVEKLRVRDYADQWIENYRGRTARGFDESTRASYRDELDRRIVPYFGGYALAEIEPGDVKAWFSWLEDRGTSAAGVRKAKRVLSAMLGDALEENRLRHGNPCLGVRYVPAQQPAPKAKPRGLTPDEFAAFLAVVSPRHRTLFAFLGHTGVRIGEALGLRWEHVNLADDPSVEIREQVYKGARKVRPKTHHSIRQLPLSPGMAQALSAHRQATEWSRPQDPVFASLTGAPLDYSRLRATTLVPAIEASGIDWPKGVGFHMFRKTAATIGHHRGGWSDRQLADILGHADPGFTKRTYVGASDRPAEVAFLDELMPVEQIEEASSDDPVRLTP